MGDILSISNAYQLAAFLIVVGFQAWTKWGVSKLAGAQSQIKEELEGTRVQMFHLANLSGAPIIRTEGRIAGLAATIEAALKVAYLQGKVDGKGGDVPYPQTRIVNAAHTLAEHALQGGPLVSHAPGSEHHEPMVAAAAEAAAASPPAPAAEPQP